VWLEWIQSLHPLQFFPCSSTALASHKTLKVLTSFYIGLMKILFPAKHGSCLEILAISLQILSFGSCKACGLLIQTLPFNVLQKQLHRLKSEIYRVTIHKSTTFHQVSLLWEPLRSLPFLILWRMVPELTF
jgi:hypothetical protein